MVEGELELQAGLEGGATGPPSPAGGDRRRRRS